MTGRERATLLACAIAILIAGAAIGASAVATHFIPAPTAPTLDDGAIDFGTDRQVNP